LPCASARRHGACRIPSRRKAQWPKSPEGAPYSERGSWGIPFHSRNTDRPLCGGPESSSSTCASPSTITPSRSFGSSPSLTSHDRFTYTAQGRLDAGRPSEEDSLAKRSPVCSRGGARSLLSQPWARIPLRERARHLAGMGKIAHSPARPSRARQPRSGTACAQCRPRAPKAAPSHTTPSQRGQLLNFTAPHAPAWAAKIAGA